jgi:ribosomal protein L2
MKRKPNWKLMSEKDKKRYRDKYGTRTPAAGRKRSQKPMFMTAAESRELLKKAKLPNPSDFITRKIGKELTKAGVEYWRADILSGTKSTTRGVPL